MKKIVVTVVFICSLGILNAQNKLEVEFKTGDDDLAVRDPGIQENLKLTVNFKSGATPLVLANANNNQTWPKNSFRRVSIPLAAGINVNDFASINLYRKSTSNNFEDMVADNWDLKELTVTLTLKNDSGTVKYRLLNLFGRPLNRFKGGINCDCNKTYNFSNPVVISGKSEWIDRTPPQNTATIFAEFGTGGDDLRGGNDNIKLVIKFKSGAAPVIVNNLNSRRNWGNFTDKKIEKDLPNPDQINIDDIKEVELWHTGGGGMGADNWDLDKFKLTISVRGISKTLVDKVGTPLHRFTGDTRRMVFAVE